MKNERIRNLPRCLLGVSAGGFVMSEGDTARALRNEVSMIVKEWHRRTWTGRVVFLATYPVYLTIICVLAVVFAPVYLWEKSRGVRPRLYRDL